MFGLKIKYKLLIQSGVGTGPMMPDNQHFYSNALVLIPVGFYLKMRS